MKKFWVGSRNVHIMQT